MINNDYVKCIKEQHNIIFLILYYILYIDGWAGVYIVYHFGQSPYFEGGKNPVYNSRTTSKSDLFI